MQPLARPVGAQRQEMELDVGQVHVGPRARKGADGARADGEDAAPREDVFKAGEQLLPAAVPYVIEAAVAVAGIDEAHLQVVLQVLADARQARAARERLQP